MQPLSILFAGQANIVRLLDGSEVQVFIRALPQRFLGKAIECCEFSHALIELCAYIKAESVAGQSETIPPPAAPAYPDIPPPAGYVGVPLGWSDNLSDGSADEIYALAQKLNFQRAADWAKGRIAAKKLVAPLHEAAIAQVMPLLERVMQPLLTKLDALSSSTPSAPSSSATAGKSS